MKHVLACLLCVLLFGCAEEHVDLGTGSEPIRVAVLPDQSKERLLAKYAPLLVYLERETSLEFDLAIPQDYADLLQRFDAGQVDLAWFGGLTFAQAAETSQAIPLAFRDVDRQFMSCYLASAADTRTMIDQFEGESFSFGPRLSTSGHLMPRYYMAAVDLDPEKFFASIKHSAAHDQTAMWVSNGTVTLGVANCVIVRSLLDHGVLTDADLRIVETTPPYSDYVWAVAPTVDQRIRTSILDALLALDATIPEHRAILRLQGANSYLPAGISDFQIIREAAIQAGVLVEDGNR